MADSTFGNIGQGRIEKRNGGILRFAFFMMILVMFANFAWFMWGQLYVSGVENIVSNTKSKAVYWQTALAEQQVFSAQGYDIDWLYNDSWEKLWTLLGNFAPFFQMITLRCYALILHLPLFLALSGVALCEGRISYATKIQDFRNISSTLYHIAVSLLCISVVFIALYISVPFGIETPFGVIPVFVTVSLFPGSYTVWLASPLLWLICITPIAMLCIYIISSNLTKNI